MDTTRGRQLVGISFNPSQDSKVDQVKHDCADLIDLLNEQPVVSDDGAMIRDKAIEAIMTAQMWAVKSLTYRN